MGKASQVRQFAFRLRERLAPASVTLVLAALRGILSQAVDDEILATNPATRIGQLLPKCPQRPEIYPLTREELTHLLTTIQTHRPQHLPLFLTLARTGMRLGEALGLQWEDIDWHSCVVHVQHSYTSGRITTPKNGKTRRVDMSTQLTDVLQDWQTRCEIDTLQRGWTEMSPWVFYTSTKRPFDDANLRNGTWYPCLTKAGLRRIRIHDLRHTYASRLIQQGESLVYIRDQLGHHSISLTVDTYGHPVPGGNRQAVDKLDDAPECNPRATITL